MIVKELLQGKPIRHPLHPILVHLPTGLFVFSLLLDLAGLLFGPNNALVRGAFYTALFGTVMAVLAAIPGLVDWADIRADHEAKRPATLHMILNLSMIALYAVNIGLRWGDLGATQTPILPLIFSLLGVGILSVSGYLGGTIVYDDGIAVGRHRRHTETPRDTLHAKGDGFVPVADAAGLGEGETLRAEVNGNVMAIAKVDGGVYAFQEFCTHRFGPLSEGTFDGHDVKCPWHGSCFDVRSGKVTRGPAKVDLRTYEVKVQDGKIMVKTDSESVKAETSAARSQAAR